MTTWFSRRVPSDLRPNRVARALARLRADGVRVTDLTQSNPTRVGIDYGENLLAPLASASALRYEPQPLGLPSAREAVAVELRRQGLAIDPARVVLTASTSEAYSMLFKLLCDPGEAVLVPTPSYPLFEHLAALDAVRVTPYGLDEHGGWSVDPAVVEAALTPDVRAIIVVSPNNPTGTYLKRTELSRLAVLCRERSLALIGDEVFFDYALAGRPAGAVSVLEQQDALTFGLGGLSKSAGLPQVKLGWMAVGGPDALVARALERLEHIADTYLGVSAPVQHAAASLIAAGAGVRAQILERVRANLATIVRLAGKAPSVRLHVPEGGWSAVLQVPAVRAEEELVLELLEDDRVLVHPGYFFDFPREAFLVLSLLPRSLELEEGLGRVLARAETRSAD